MVRQPIYTTYAVNYFLMKGKDSGDAPGILSVRESLPDAWIGSGVELHGNQSRRSVRLFSFDEHARPWPGGISRDAYSSVRSQMEGAVYRRRHEYVAD